jgi:hypothetical protein
MKSYLAKILVLALALTLGVVFAVVSGQEPEDDQLAGGISIQEIIEPSGLAQAPPAGKKVLYMFTGVRHRDTSPKYSTVVHCTNHGASTVTLTIELFDSVGGFGLATFPPPSVAPNRTLTIDTTGAGLAQPIQFGSGRVLGNDSPNTKVICTAQVIDAESSPPNTIAALEMFQQ